MKKVASCILIICFALSVLCGCSENDKSKINSSSSSTSATQSEKTSSSADSKSTDKKSPVDASWFDDAVFVGDSITLRLNYYCDSNPDALGKVQFFCAGSLGYTNALWDINQEGNVHPQYKGKAELSENCAKLTGASKVFVMLGMNDIGAYGEDGALESAKTLIGRIHKNSPDAVIYIQSVTPMIQDKETDVLNNEKIRSFNKLLKDYCEKSNYKYLDIYNLLADENGCLPLDYCGDADAMGIHFNEVSCGMWVDYLKANV